MGQMLRELADSVLCTKRGRLVYGRFAKMKRVTSTLAKVFACEERIETTEEVTEPEKEL